MQTYTPQILPQHNNPADVGMNVRILRRIMTEPCFLSGGAFGALLLNLGKPEDPQAAEHPAIAKARERLKPIAKVGSDGIAVIDITGTLAAKPDVLEVAFYGYEDSLAVADVIGTAAQNPNVRGILLNWDSPGGYLTGGPEIGALIALVRKVKPVVSWTGGQMCSLAYWIASQSTAVFASPSAQVGSIGVYSAVLDCSKAFEEAGVKVDVFRNAEAIYKAAGIPGTSLTGDHRTMLQANAQAWFETFKADVLAARPQVNEESMRGQSFPGAVAKAAGLIDGIGGIDYARAALKHTINRRA